MAETAVSGSQSNKKLDLSWNVFNMQDSLDQRVLHFGSVFSLVVLEKRSLFIERALGWLKLDHSLFDAKV